MSDDDNRVGYKNPPKKHQFRKGRSGNPNGRPKRRISSDDAEIIRRLDAEEIIVGGRKVPRRKAEIQRILSSALKGDRKARRLIERLAKTIVKPRRGGVLVVPWKGSKQGT